MEEVGPRQFMHLGLDAWKVLGKSLGRYALRRLGKYYAGEAVDPTLHIKPFIGRPKYEYDLPASYNRSGFIGPLLLFSKPQARASAYGFGGETKFGCNDRTSVQVAPALSERCMVETWILYSAIACDSYFN